VGVRGVAPELCAVPNSSIAALCVTATVLQPGKKRRETALRGKQRKPLI
jgi:hypothetical protein